MQAGDHSAPAWSERPRGVRLGTTTRQTLRRSRGELTIYSSLPLQGRLPSAVGGRRACVRARARRAREPGRRLRHQLRVPRRRRSGGRFLDTRAGAANAWEAANDPSTIAYLGEFNSGATTVSLPILNHAGIPQVSPSNTYAGLTRARWRASRASPTCTTPPGSGPSPGGAGRPRPGRRAPRRDGGAGMFVDIHRPPRRDLRPRAGRRRGAQRRRHPASTSSAGPSLAEAPSTR